MRTEETVIGGVYELWGACSRDDRGTFRRLIDLEWLQEHGLFGPVAHVNVSDNPVPHTLRGLHYQIEPRQERKVVSCLRGLLFDVAVDLRPGSETYGSWYGTMLSNENGKSLIVPEGCAHGFLTMEENTLVHYMMSAPYDADLARGLRWNDPVLAIDWPAMPELISPRDASLAFLDSQAVDDGQEHDS